ncbi:MAG: sulfite exporter TauE/SafE family protein [Methanobrevibacter sp.]|uniref:sulfite exporter TauE/SafE family protein n=1 Tax=Methanobrevibacter sp. TaxID=66852 RepID=UPI0026DFF69A|nr:sulfite exporter TauE/SafE family protein [Methanobrevibacter sp.]MDO5848892.1 sulfite exporter TauE/SafE family protein [Methanobrevibacter sp.]
MIIIFSIEYIIGLALIGIVAGFASGLLGVGGGFLIVPLQLFLMESIDVDPRISMLVALGTSLAIIIPTSISGAYRHSKSTSNMVKPGIKLGVFGIVGSLIGGQLASILPTDILQFIFGIFLICIAIYNFLTINKKDSESKIKFNLINAAIIGIGIGILSGLLGVGGGIFVIVALTALLGFALVDAVGISSVYICLTAVGGVISYIVSGWGVNPLPYSVGYINLINWFFIAICSVPLAYFGANVSHSLPEKRLKQVFAIILVYIGLRMLGVLP